MTTALITGGLGFIGSYIAKDLLDNNVVDKVVCLDHFASYVDVTNTNYQDYRHKRFIGYEEKIIVERDLSFLEEYNWNVCTFIPFLCSFINAVVDK